MIFKRQCQVEHRDDLSTYRVEVHTSFGWATLPRSWLLPRVQLVAGSLELAHNVSRDPPALRDLDPVSLSPGTDGVNVDPGARLAAGGASDAHLAGLAHVPIQGLAELLGVSVAEINSVGGSIESELDGLGGLAAIN